MRTEQVIAALDGRNLGELTQVDADLLEGLTAALGPAPAAGDQTLRGLLHGVLDGLGQVRVDGVISDQALTDSVVALQRAEARVMGEKLRRIAELAARKAHHGKAMSAGDWLGPSWGCRAGRPAPRPRRPKRWSAYPTPPSGCARASWVPGRPARPPATWRS